MKKNERLAQKHCANYDSGQCLGVELKITSHKGKKVPVMQKLNPDKAGKNCSELVDNCNYLKIMVCHK